MEKFVEELFEMLYEELGWWIWLGEFSTAKELLQVQIGWLPETYKWCYEPLMETLQADSIGLRELCLLVLQSLYCLGTMTVNTVVVVPFRFLCAVAIAATAISPILGGALLFCVPLIQIGAYIYIGFLIVRPRETVRFTGSLIKQFSVTLAEAVFSYMRECSEFLIRKGGEISRKVSMFLQISFCKLCRFWRYGTIQYADLAVHVLIEQGVSPETIECRFRYRDTSLVRATKDGAAHGYIVGFTKTGEMVAREIRKEFLP